MWDGEFYGVERNMEDNTLLKSRIKVVIAEAETASGNKINRTELAAALGITAIYLSAIIAGKKVPNAELVFKLAKLLNCKVDDLYIYEEEIINAAINKEDR